MMDEIFGMRNEGRGPRPFGKKHRQSTHNRNRSRSINFHDAYFEN